jgi:hypothetical protein
MNPCIKTGANVWLESGHAIHGDLYVCHGNYVLRYNTNGKYRHDLTPDDCDALFLDLQAEQYSVQFPENVNDFLDLHGAGVIIIAESAARVSPELLNDLLAIGCVTEEGGPNAEV